MHKLFFILLLCSSHLLAIKSFDVVNIQKNINLTSYMYFQKDTNNSFSPEEILKNNSLKQQDKSNAGYMQGSYWSVLKLTNSSKKKKTVVLFNPRSGMDYINVFIYKQGKVEVFNLGDMLPLENRSLPSVFSNIMLDIDSKEEVILVSQVSNIGPLEMSWLIQDIATFLHYDKLDTILISLYYGFLISIMIYTFFMFFLFRDKIYLVYSMYLAFAILANSSLQGSLHYVSQGYLDYFSITLLNWNILHLSLALLWLFVLYFFKFEKSKKYYYAILSLITYNVFLAIFYTFAYLDSSILKYTNYIALTALLETLFMLFISIEMYRKKKHGSLYFFLSHLFYSIVVIQYIFTLIGKYEFNIYNRHSLELAVVLMITFMTIALSARLKGIKEENEQMKSEIERNKRYVMIGTTISYITHQWKQPLSILSAKTLSLAFHIDTKPNDPVIVFKDKVKEVEDGIMFLSETLDNIKKLFTSQSTKDKELFIANIIMDTKELLNDQLQKSNIIFQYSIDKNIKTFGNKNLLLHVLNNIIQNSIDQFKPSDTDKKIMIECSKNENFITLTLEDNAGGITLEKVNDVFNAFNTTKSFGTGLGLSLSKDIIESKFNGSIKVENKNNGACFTVTLANL